MLNSMRKITITATSFYVILGQDQNHVWGEKMNILVAVSHLLITLNCSCNFAIYCAKVCVKKF